MNTITILNEITAAIRAEEPNVNDLIKLSNKIEDLMIEDELKAAYYEMIEAVLDLII